MPCQSGSRVVSSVTQPRMPSPSRKTCSVPDRKVAGEDGGVRISLVPLLNAVRTHPGDAGVFECHQVRQVCDDSGKRHRGFLGPPSRS